MTRRTLRTRSNRVVKASHLPRSAVLGNHEKAEVGVVMEQLKAWAARRCRDWTSGHVKSKEELKANTLSCAEAGLCWSISSRRSCGLARMRCSADLALITGPGSRCWIRCLILGSVLVLDSRTVFGCGLRALCSFPRHLEMV